MFTSPVLRTVGLVWKPIRAKPTTRRNDRARAADVKNVEQFLSKYSLQSWNKTNYANLHNKQSVNAVARDNYEAQSNIEAQNALIRQQRLEKALAKRKKQEDNAKKEKVARDAAAASLVQRLTKDGQLRPYPAF